MANKPTAKTLVSKQTEQEQERIKQEVTAFEKDYLSLCIKHGYAYFPRLVAGEDSITGVMNVKKLSENGLKAYQELLSNQSNYG